MSMFARNRNKVLVFDWDNPNIPRVGQTNTVAKCAIVNRFGFFGAT